MIGVIYNQGAGGVSINGIIKRYLVNNGSNVNAGDFVKFLSNTIGTSTASTAGYRAVVKAVKIDESRVFVVSGTASGFLQGCVYTISGNTITAGSVVRINQDNISSVKVEAKKINDNEVLVLFVKNSPYTIYGNIVNINNTTITPSTDIELINNGNSNSIDGLDTIGTNRFLLLYSYGFGDTNLSVLEVNNGAITAGTSQNIANGNGGVNVITIEENKALVLFIRRSISPTSIYGTVAEINGTSITLNSEVNICTPNAVMLCNGVLLDANKIFVAFAYGSSTQLYGRIVNINGTTITTGAQTQISNITYSGKNTSVVKIGSDMVYISHGDSGNDRLQGITATINGNTITSNNDNTTLDSATYSSTATAVEIGGGNMVFTGYAGSSAVSGILYFLNVVDTLSSNSDTILGVADESGNSLQNINVYIPNI